ncbi:hypothetical protein K437DRAFT_276776 [Tilletiaria anomala UBC 951]|uniref:Mediator of RNA polymerase II transcription subunit 5 n=1 Tax=Tilletiaria anomala (strain ATCC 24038 / CBS 436.72 / UBC 951) TaxID=1037660 RepID=A0A066V4B1_TILAU|nr:uncharacterized protein K437DRAFT_276776 [Tilletiaria anomala UBC 951]KDN36557.1 hypothetical protein K437DRAFT_276776 [Tilletiaria anomala UBC 951]
MTQEVASQVVSITVRCFFAGTTASKWSEILKHLRARNAAADQRTSSSSAVTIDAWEASFVSDSILQLLLDTEAASCDALVSYVKAACEVQDDQSPRSSTVVASAANVNGDHEPLMRPRDFLRSFFRQLIGGNGGAILQAMSRLEPLAMTIQSVGLWRLNSPPHPIGVTYSERIKSADDLIKVLDEAARFIDALGISVPAASEATMCMLADVMVPAVLAAVSSSDKACIDLDEKVKTKLSQRVPPILFGVQRLAALLPSVAQVALELVARFQEIVGRIGGAQMPFDAQVASQESPNQVVGSRSALSTLSWRRVMELPESKESLQTMRSPDIWQLSVVQPEIAILVTKIAEPRVPWQSKLSLLRNVSKARRGGEYEDIGDPTQSFWFEVLHATAIGCAYANAIPASTAGSRNAVVLWRAALCSIVPSAMRAFADSDESHPQDYNLVVKALFLTSEGVLQACGGPEVANEKSASLSGDAGTHEGDNANLNSRATIPSLLLRSLIEKRLISSALAADVVMARAAEVDLTSLGTSLSAMSSAQGSSVQALIEQRLSADNPLTFFDQMRYDYGTQCLQAKLLVEQFTGWISSKDLETAANWSRILVDHCATLDIIVSHTSPQELFRPVCQWLNADGLLNPAEESTSVGTLILFAQLLIKRYQVCLPELSDDQLSSVIRSDSWAYQLHELSKEHRALVDRWITALFDSDGISDELLRESPPRTLLLLAPTLFAQSIATCRSGLIDLELLRNGLTYFLEDPLSYTLPGALLWLLDEIQRTPLIAKSERGPETYEHSRVILMEILGMLLDAEKCPAAVQSLVEGEMLAFGLSSESQTSMQGWSTTVDTSNLKHKLVAGYTEHAYLPAKFVLHNLLQLPGSVDVPTLSGLWTAICAPSRLSCSAVLAELANTHYFFHNTDLKAAAMCLVVLELSAPTSGDGPLAFSLARLPSEQISAVGIACTFAALKLLAASADEALADRLGNVLLLISLHICRHRARKALDPSRLSVLSESIDDAVLRRLPKWQAVHDALAAPDGAFEGL